MYGHGNEHHPVRTAVGRFAAETVPWLRQKKDAQPFRSVRAEYQNSFNVTCPARAGDEGNHTRVSPPIFGSKRRICLSEVGNQLASSCDNNVVWRKDAQDATAVVRAGDADRSGLRDEEFALGDSGVAGLEGVLVVALVNCQKVE